MKIENVALTAPICRAARGLLGWSAIDLAGVSMVSRSTIAAIESEKRLVSYERTFVDIVRAFEDAGIEFIRRHDGTIRGVAFR